MILFYAGSGSHIRFRHWRRRTNSIETWLPTISGTAPSVDNSNALFHADPPHISARSVAQRYTDEQKMVASGPKGSARLQPAHARLYSPHRFTIRSRAGRWSYASWQALRLDCSLRSPTCYRPRYWAGWMGEAAPGTHTSL